MSSIMSVTRPESGGGGLDASPLVEGCGEPRAKT